MLLKDKKCGLSEKITVIEVVKKWLSENITYKYLGGSVGSVSDPCYEVNNVAVKILLIILFSHYQEKFCLHHSKV